MLQIYYSALLDTGSWCTSTINLIRFVIEQLELMQVPKNGRRYSMSILISSFFWQLSSTSLYKRLQDFFILPSLSKLHRLSRGITVEARELDLQYLKQSSSSLTKQERIVTLMIDEVYTAQ